MTTSIWQQLAETPWWVYVIFILFLRIAYLATKPQVIAIKQLYMLSIIFFTFSLISLFYLSISLQHVFLWLSTLLAGSLLGWLHFRLLKIKVLKAENKLQLPGTYSVFILIGIIVFAKYYFQLDMYWLMNSIVLASLYGLCSGLFIGRAFYVKRALK